MKRGRDFDSTRVTQSNGVDRIRRFVLVEQERRRNEIRNDDTAVVAQANGLLMRRTDDGMVSCQQASNWCWENQDNVAGEKIIKERN